MTTYLRLLFTAAMCCLGVAAASGQTVLEDFEGDLTLVFNDGRGNGDFSVVENPDSSSRNPSDMVGQYVKDTTAGFSLLIADLPEPFTLTAENNQLFIDIRASEDTRVLAKLEGTVGSVNVETSSNIPVANQWRRYRFDLSDVEDGEEFTKFILFFDFGNRTGGGTYFFDNIALGSDDCAGTARDVTIVDDYECQRQEPLRGGDLDLEIVDNPDPDDINGEGPVGAFTDPGGAFSNLAYNFFAPIDLDANPVVKLKYWSPVANLIGIKVQDGAGSDYEVEVEITEEQTGEWQEIAVDMSPASGSDYTTLVIFPNFKAGGGSEVYYLDDIRFAEAEPLDFLEDFEGDATLFFGVLNDNAAQNGSFEVIDNPDQSDANDSEKVGEYTTGSAAQSTLFALNAEPFDLSVNSQLNMLLWAPEGATTVRASAISPDGRQDVTRQILATERWIDVSFNFSDLTDDTEVNRIEFIFDGGTAEAGRVYYIDNIIFGEGTVDPCEGVEPVANVLDDFECQRNATLVNGAANIAIIANPDQDGNTSGVVAEYTRPAGDGTAFSNISYTFEEPLDLSVFNRVHFQLWSPVEVPIVAKFEASANGTADVETAPMTVTATNSWQTYTFDLSAAEGGEFQQLTLFINFNTAPSTEDVYYLDNVELVRGPRSGCVFDFESPASAPTSDFNTFAGGPVNDTAFAVIPNPDMSGINTSETVGRFTEGPDAEGAQPFAGVIFALGAPATFADNDKVLRLKFWGPEAISVVSKLERPSIAGANGTGNLVADYTTPGEWQELTYDLTDFDTEGAGWQGFTLIPNFNPDADRAANFPSEVTDYYFDEVQFGSQGDCRLVNDVRAPRAAVEQLEAYPNPATDQLTVTLPEGAAEVLVYDGLGRQVIAQREALGFGSTTATLDVSGLATGLHVVIARDARGSVLGQVRVNVTGR